MGRNGHHQQEARFSAIHDAERKAPLTSMERAPAAAGAPPAGMSRGAFDGGLHCSLETDTGTRARLAVVIDLMQQLRLGCWAGTRWAASLRQCAYARGQTRLQLAGPAPPAVIGSQAPTDLIRPRGVQRGAGRLIQGRQQLVNQSLTLVGRQLLATLSKLMCGVSHGKTP